MGSDVITAVGAMYEEPVNLTMSQKEILRALIREELVRRASSVRRIRSESARTTGEGSLNNIMNRMIVEELNEIQNKLA